MVNFANVFQWFQFIAVGGMYTVNYPPVYRDFTKNFAWAAGLVTWGSLQRTIDTLRAHTGGNLTEMNYEYLKNAKLVYSNFPVQRRDLSYAVGNNTGSANSTVSSTSRFVSGISAFAESLLVPSAKY